MTRLTHLRKVTGVVYQDGPLRIDNMEASRLMKHGDWSKIFSLLPTVDHFLQTPMFSPCLWDQTTRVTRSLLVWPVTNTKH